MSVVREFVKDIKEVLVEGRYKEVNCYHEDWSVRQCWISIGPSTDIYCNLNFKYFLEVVFVHQISKCKRIKLTGAEKRLLRKELKKIVKGTKKQKPTVSLDVDLY